MPWTGQSSKQAPWEQILSRLECLRDDPSCRRSLYVHTALLGLVFVLAAARQWLVSHHYLASKSERLRSRAQIDSIIVYPIKSCAGVLLKEAQIGLKGLELDRRWMVLRRGKEGKWQKMSLREEPKLTLIQPAIEAEALRLSLSQNAQRPDLTSIRIPLQGRPDAQVVPSIDMWGDTADGVLVDEILDDPLDSAPTDKKQVSTPSQWISSFLGYEVILLQFRPQGPRRNAFPLYKTPDMLGVQGGTDDEALQELRAPRGIEFQDEYPLLVCTVESLEALRSQIQDAVLATDGTDGRGGQPVGGKLFKPEQWREKVLSAEAIALKESSGGDNGVKGGTGEHWLSIQRFRPNIVLRSCTADDEEHRTPPIKAWEEDLWTKLEFDADSGCDHGQSQKAQHSSQPSEDGGHIPSSSVEMHLVSRCERCLLTAVDPVTAEKDVSVPLAFLRRSNNKVKKRPLDADGTPIRKTADGKATGRAGPIFGVYAVVPADKGGKLAVGQGVSCIWSREQDRD